MKKLFLLLNLFAAFAANAVIFSTTGDPQFNTSAPTTDHPFNRVGDWQGVTATPISSNWFLAAKHVGGGVGSTFDFEGVQYLVVESIDAPIVDLKLCRVSGAFPNWTPLYRGGSESGRILTVVGRGTQRGEELFSVSTKRAVFDMKAIGCSRKEVLARYPDAEFHGHTFTATVTRTVFNGWLWGSFDGVRRWGTCRITTADEVSLISQFEVGPDFCSVSPGDSSAGVFIQDGDEWFLAGVVNSTDGVYSAFPDGPEFGACVLDKTGLCFGPFRFTGPDIPTRSFFSRVSQSLSWIDERVK